MLTAYLLINKSLSKHTKPVYNIGHDVFGAVMKVYIKFVAFGQLLPREFTAIELWDDADVGALLKVVYERWEEYLKSYCDEVTHDLSGSILVASQGRVLQTDEMLYDGQELQLIGQIIGG